MEKEIIEIVNLAKEIGLVESELIKAYATTNKGLIQSLIRISVKKTRNLDKLVVEFLKKYDCKEKEKMVNLELNEKELDFIDRLLINVDNWFYTEEQIEMAQELQSKTNELLERISDDN